MSRFKVGGTDPIETALLDADGAAVTTGTTNLTVQKCSDDTYFDAVDYAPGTAVNLAMTHKLNGVWAYTPAAGVFPAIGQYRFTVVNSAAITRGWTEYVDSARAADIPTAAQNADAVWDEASAGHLIADTTGAKLDAATAVANVAGTVLIPTVTADSQDYGVLIRGGAYTTVVILTRATGWTGADSWTWSLLMAPLRRGGTPALTITASSAVINDTILTLTFTATAAETAAAAGHGSATWYADVQSDDGESVPAVEFYPTAAGTVVVRDAAGAR